MIHPRAQPLQPRVGDRRASDTPARTDPPTADEALVAALCAGDESAYVSVVTSYTPAMLRVARLYVRGQAVAEEVVQETWLRVLRSIDGFDHRSSLRTWVFVILANCARRRAEREARSTPASMSDDPGDGLDGTSFFPAGHPRWAGMWTTLVPNWDEHPEQGALSQEVREQLTEAVRALPPNYATVFTLRDIEGWDAGEVCALLGITAENQRVLLHRARTRLRAALAPYFGGEGRSG